MIILPTVIRTFFSIMALLILGWLYHKIKYNGFLAFLMAFAINAAIKLSLTLGYLDTGGSLFSWVITASDLALLVAVIIFARDFVKNADLINSDT